MTLTDLLDHLYKIEHSDEDGIGYYYSNLQEKTAAYYREYLTLIKTLNFVFKNKRNKTNNKKTIISLEKVDIYSPSDYEKFDDIYVKRIIDLNSCTFLYCYVLGLYANGFREELDCVKNDILNAFKSINRKNPSYYEKVSMGTKKKKSHDSKRDCLRALYSRIMGKRSSKAYLTVYQDLIKKIESCDLEHLECLVKEYREKIDGKGCLIAYREDIDKIGKEYESLRDDYLEKIFQIRECMWDSVYDNGLTFPNIYEISFIEFLYKLCKKYGNRKKATPIDLRLSKNHQKWFLLNQEERDSLTNYLHQLDDDDNTYLKYIKCDDEKEARIRFLSIIDSINDSKVYAVEAQLEYILDLFEDSVKEEYVSNRFIECWKEMAKSIENAYNNCTEIKEIIRARKKALPPDECGIQEDETVLDDLSVQVLQAIEVREKDPSIGKTQASKDESTLKSPKSQDNKNLEE